jgi:Ca2+-transporting ATPase
MLIGIQDLPRHESKTAIKSCHKGGVVVIMVTGDNKLTARAIADQVGITEPGQNLPGLVMEGKEIEKLSPDQPPHEI